MHWRTPDRSVIRRRKPIDRGSTPLKRGTSRIAQRSAKVLAQLPERARVVDAAWERDKGRCQAEYLVPEIRCGGPLDAHELVPRSAWAQGYLDVDNVMIVCRAHHRWIDNNPEAAHAVGLHKMSWER